MNIPTDKLQHLKWGLGLAVLLGATLLVAKVNPAAAIAAGSCAQAIGVELYQKARREGTASWADALATATPGLLLALLVQFVG